MYRKFLYVTCASMFLLSGCLPFLTSVTEDQPFGTLDPNTVQPWIDAAVAAGLATQTIGTATGNPALIGMGVLVATIASVLGIGLLKKKGGD